MNSQASLALVAAVALGGKLLRGRRSARLPPPPPMTTQSSPGQIADLQQAYGADMAATSSLPSAEGTAER
jgi:hypothetical protein